LKRLVLLGGGHSHVEVLKRFGRSPLAGVELILVSPYRYAAYSGMLPGLIAGHYTRQECHIDLALLADYAGCKFICHAATKLRLSECRIEIEDGSTLDYDNLSLDIGSVPPLAAITGASDFAIQVKPVETFLHSWEQIIARAMSGHGVGRIAVVGGGAGGVELLLAAQYRLDSPLASESRPVQFHLLTNTASILPTHSVRVRRIFERIFSERRIDVRLNSEVVAVQDGGVRCSDGSIVETDYVIWATGAASPPLIANNGLRVDDRGFVVIDNHLQSLSHPEVFAAGDVASMLDQPRPKSGVYAVRQGPSLANNLRCALRGKALRRFAPQSGALALISTGNKFAVASRGELAVQGAWVWRIKDFIDRRFVAGYNRL
jgi:selenide, water dikinase